MIPGLSGSDRYSMEVEASRSQLVAALARVAGGDRAALQIVYQDTSAKLFGVCVRILNDRSEAEDVLQEVYLTVWRKAASFDPARASPITWLHVSPRTSSRARGGVPGRQHLRGAGRAHEGSARHHEELDPTRLAEAQGLPGPMTDDRTIIQ